MDVMRSPRALHGQLPRAPRLSLPSKKELLSLGVTQLAAANLFGGAGLTIEVLRVGTAEGIETSSIINVCSANVKTVPFSYANVRPAPLAQGVLRLSQAQILRFTITNGVRVLLEMRRTGH